MFMNQDQVPAPTAPQIFSDSDILIVGKHQHLHGFDADPIADVGDLCDSDCIDCD